MLLWKNVECRIKSDGVCHYVGFTMNFHLSLKKKSAVGVDSKLSL